MTRQDSDLDEVIEELRELAKKAEDPDDKAKWYKLYLDAMSLKWRDAKKTRGKGFDLG